MAPRKPVKSTYTAPAKTKKSEKSDVSFFQSVKNFFCSEKTHTVTAIILIIIVLYLFFAFLSYFLTGASDQNLMDLSFGEMQKQRNEIHNWMGVLGAFFAHNIIHRWFGVSAFALLIFTSFAGLKLLKIKTPSLWKSFFHCAFWLIWLSVTLGFTVNSNDIFFAPSGLHGIEASKFLISYIGTFGMILVITGALLIYSIISLNSALPFLKSLFKKKEKYAKKYANENNKQNTDNELYNNTEDDEQNVAIGTEIVPDEWIDKDRGEDDDFIIERAVTEEDVKNVGFEIENPKPKEENVTTIKNDNAGSEENDDPFYNIEKLGKYDPTLELVHYIPPVIDLLKVYNAPDKQFNAEEQYANKDKIVKTLLNYGIEIDKIKATVGPTITLYEIVPKAGVRISKIRNLEYDIMLSLAATGIRIIAPIPGKGTIGIEVPNADPQVVSMNSVIASKRFQESKFDLPVAFGRTITDEVFMVDLTKMPHLLVAGATGQGKSVGLNAIITSLLYKKHPAELKLVLVDPKKVEFNIYADIDKHFLAKLPDGEDAIITDVTKVVETLNSLCKEMDDRYDLLKKAHTRNIKEYNEKFVNRHLNPEKGHRFLPYIVVIVDEFGDLIMTAGKEVEMPIARIAQLARAVGIHMIIATQRPSVNIITGVIKANFPARVAFRVSSMIDSRTILDAPGANQLVGRGDMLFSQGNDLIRVQCAFVDTPEVENIVHFIGNQQGYPTAFYLPEYLGAEGDTLDVSSVDMSKRDPLFEEAARLIVAHQQGSTSLIQRKFSIGYNRAGRIVDQLEVAGIIGPFEGSKARQVLVMDDYHLEQILKNL
ncbi:MAG: DNA translocase FtsK [Paludibacter sp.]|jgi:S-DNA-T family DNA segregation ATPase FtsK/SpoIIIE|nr:DNA translocase FtsK [Paludibacter sp.]